jgi:predicted Fe-Mo cluster-binding NifX family protein
MKVAITSTGNSPESTLDSRFGRCSYFVIYDTMKRAIRENLSHRAMLMMASSIWQLKSKL